MAFNNTVIARTAAAVWGLKLGYATTQAVLAQANTTAGGLDAVINAAYVDSYAGVSNATIASVVAGNLGLTGTLATAASDYIVAQLAGLSDSAKGAKLSSLVGLFSGLTSDASFGAAATAFNTKVAAAVAYASIAANTDATFATPAAATSFNLTTSQDTLTGSAGDDTFNAFQIGSANSLSSGDSINGGAGTDTLSADLAAGTGLTTPVTTNVEVVSIRAQERASSSGDNNNGDGTGSGTTANTIVTIDAQRMVNVDRWESNNSRADLKIEDVRIPDAEITKDTTIAMVSTDPGNVDFAVYFDQHSLRAFSGSSGTLKLEVMDVFARAAGKDPLKDSPYDTIKFVYDGATITLSSQAINDAQTYAQLKDAIVAEIAKQPVLKDITVSIITNGFTVPGRTEQGDTILLSASNHTFGIGTWIASQGVPPLSLFYTNQDTTSQPNQDLVTSTVVLDDVGRGSMGGDLVIGGLSMGETSTSKGVERFNITVERSSKLQTISSTNNTLQEVVFTQGTKVDPYNTTGNVGKPGAVTVTGRTDLAGGLGYLGGVTSNGQNTQEGVDSVTPFSPATGVHGAYGFTDVRLIDGSALTGKMTFDAQITANSYAKYIDVGDTQSAPTGDNTSPVGQKIQRADFIYSGGSNNDTIYVQADSTITGSESRIEAGREDFSFVLNGNGGDDTLTFVMVTPGLVGNTEFWYQNQKLNKNVTINAGAGDDTVNTPGAGDIKINLDAGADTAYTDNTGSKAQWVFNTTAQATTPDAGGVAARNVNDLLSSANTGYNLYKGSLTVQFLGITADGATPAGSLALVSKSVPVGYNTSTFKTSDLYINQAIKNAINTDPVLSKLLVAADGPANTLVVTSLIDGALVSDNLRVNLVTTTDTLTATEIAALNKAWEPLTAFVTSADAITAMGRTNPGATYFPAGSNNLNNFDSTGDYKAALTNNGGAGANGGTASLTSSDNTITGGTGNDVIVLGTTELGSQLASSNEVVVYSGPFDNDTIVHFDINGNGIDKLSFVGLGGTGSYLYQGTATQAAATADLTAPTDGLIYVQALDTATNSFNDTAAEIQALFTDLAGSAATATRTYVYVAANTGTNVGAVYSVTDAPGATNNVTATFMGTIDLADVTWASLTLANFS